MYSIVEEEPSIINCGFVKAGVVRELTLMTSLPFNVNLSETLKLLLTVKLKPFKARSPSTTRKHCPKLFKFKLLTRFITPLALLIITSLIPLPGKVPLPPML